MIFEYVTCCWFGVFTKYDVNANVSVCVCVFQPAFRSVIIINGETGWRYITNDITIYIWKITNKWLWTRTRRRRVGMVEPKGKVKIETIQAHFGILIRRVMEQAWRKWNYVLRRWNGPGNMWLGWSLEVLSRCEASDEVILQITEWWPVWFDRRMYVWIKVKEWWR